MSEISNKEVNENETKETNETDNKEKTSLEQYSKLSPEDQKKVREECVAFQKEHPDATKEEKRAFAAETISSKYDEANGGHDPRERDKFDERNKDDDEIDR